MALNPRSWRNGDGLNVWFGTSEGVSGKGGEQYTNGDNRVVEQVLTLTDLTTTAAFVDTHIVIPKNAFVEYVEVVVLTAATSGGAATLNIGLKGTDESTNVSDTALVSAGALATINAAGAKVTYIVGSTGAGSSLGTVLAANNHITAKAGTAVYTAGKILIRVHYNYAA